MPDLFEPRQWERNGTSFALRHVPNRISVALIAPVGDHSEVLGWLTDTDATLYAQILDRMFTDPPATYGGTHPYGGDTP